MSYVFFWVILRRMEFNCQRFGTLCLFHLHRRVGTLRTHSPINMGQRQCSETLATKLHTPENIQKENIRQDILFRRWGITHCFLVELNQSLEWTQDIPSSFRVQEHFSSARSWSNIRSSNSAYKKYGRIFLRDAFQFLPDYATSENKRQ
jgi:hypothetical protein